ncbi:MAG TPA: NAD(P)-dependent oxidoreductase, partial [Burkholderiales bacterium]|nr:NAD(P)-dependent oxidoreductase [Burkholderiales bacterium]
KAKVICKQGVGYDTIDIAAAKKHGIPVCRTPGVNSEAVAEMAMALALSVARRTTEADRLIRAGVPVQRPDILGVEMSGKTVGIIGLGNIGRLSARKWRAAFDCGILFYDPYVESDAYEKCETLGAMLPRVDLLTVHCPLNDETRGMVGAKELALMKPTAIVVSTARGGIVDEAALYEALTNQRLFGAGLDVWDEIEPPRKDHPLLQLPNVVATPHTAGNTHETQARSSLQTAMLAVEVLQGKPARNRVA